MLTRYLYGRISQRHLLHKIAQVCFKMPRINHEIMKWAREKAKLSLEDAAHKLNISDSISASAVEKLTSYESGSKTPSRSLILRMSNKYRQPLLTFYLERPPRIGDRGEDFRNLPDLLAEEIDSNVDVLIRDIKARQSIVREALIAEQDEARIDFIGKHSQKDGQEQIVKTIKEILNFDLSEFRTQTSFKEAFRYLRRQAEAAGIFVLLKGNLGSHHSNIDVTSFRGFVLSDEVAPFIVINDLDAESAWSFTLIHEMAHLLFGDTGVSGMNVKLQKEQFCNNVASEFILPEEDFKTFQLSSLNFDTLKAEISSYSKKTNVSNSHVAYRLLRRGTIERSLWRRLNDFYRNEWMKRRKKSKEENKEKEGGPNYYVVRRYKLGALLELARRLTYSGALTTTKAGLVLDMRPLKIHRLFQIV